MMFQWAGRLWLTLALCLVGGAAPQPSAAQPGPPQQVVLIDATQSSGIDFVHEDGSSGQQYLVELMGAGAATSDFDNDGWLDVLLLNGSRLPGSTLAQSPREGMFLNMHDGTFFNASSASGAGDTAYSLGVAVGDFDNDGFEDIYLSNFGPNTLLHNNGDGTFSDVSAASGTSDGAKFGAGAAFLDIEGDGDLDIVVGNYVRFDFESHARLVGTTFPYPPGPQHYAPIADTLLRNEGDGRFSDISQTSGIAAVAGPTMGLVCCDFDADGDTDIFAGCDAQPNHLYVNDGLGQFVESGLSSGVAYDVDGKAVGSMGAEAADIDNDGWIDLFVTDYSGQLPLLFRNLGGLSFDNATRASRAGLESLPHAKWGAGLIDFDNDADRDLFLCQGHLLKNASRIEQLTDFRVRNGLLLNDGRGRFRSITNQAGSGLQIVESSRGAAFDDLDNDGDVDAIVLNCAAPANLLRNETTSPNHWLHIELHGRTTNRSAVGSRVTVWVAGVQQVAEVHAGRSYQSHYGTRLHFGLGQAKSVDRIEIAWHGGGRQVLQDVAADQALILVQQP